jgi:hypothetical protein
MPMLRTSFAATYKKGANRTEGPRTLSLPAHNLNVLPPNDGRHLVVDGEAVPGLRCMEAD